MLHSVKLTDFFGFEDSVSLTFNSTWTFLVGKNGAGKSVLLESIVLAAKVATSQISPERAPKEFSCDLTLPNDRRVTYSYAWDERVIHTGKSEDDYELQYKWSEFCRTSDGILLWEVIDGIAKFETGNVTIPLPEGRGILAIKLPDQLFIPSEVHMVREILHNFYIVRAGFPRSRDDRNTIAISMPRLRKSGAFGSNVDERTSQLISTLINWSQRKPELISELNELGKRLGVFNSIEPRFFYSRSSENNEESSESTPIAATINFDNVNIGLISDGSRRIAEILQALVQEDFFGILIIEEPETAIHPGLLQRLIATLESYSKHRQIIMSTHSPMVVNKAMPSEIRIVERFEDNINVQELSVGQVLNLEKYLNDDGELSDFLYGGDLDKDE